LLLLLLDLVLRRHEDLSDVSGLPHVQTVEVLEHFHDVTLDVFLRHHGRTNEEVVARHAVVALFIVAAVERVLLPIDGLNISQQLHFFLIAQIRIYQDFDDFCDGRPGDWHFNLRLLYVPVPARRLLGFFLLVRLRLGYLEVVIPKGSDELFFDGLTRLILL